MNWITILISLHAFYISVIEMNVTEDFYAEVTLKVFSDDLSDAVRNYDGALIPRKGEYDNSHIERIQSYIDEKFFIFHKNDTVRFEIINYSSEDQSVWFNLKSNRSIMVNAHLNASYLFDIFPDQINMVHLREKDKKQFFQLKKGSENVDLDLHKN